MQREKNPGRNEGGEDARGRLLELMVEGSVPREMLEHEVEGTEVVAKLLGMVLVDHLNPHPRCPPYLTRAGRPGQSGG